MDNIFYNEVENLQENAGEPRIDPKNPFNNFTEYEDYNNDYREVVPQIDIPGCVIPFEPSKRERKRIRHYFNAVGTGILINTIAAYAVFNVIIFILRGFIMKADGVDPSDPANQYLIGLNNFFNNSSIGIGISAIIYPLFNTFTFLIGSKATKIKINSYFKTTGLTLGLLFSYFIISMFLKTASGAVNLAFYYLFDNADTAVGMIGYQYPKAIVITILYSGIFAPVGEELVYRGFVLKNLSRVSQRFGIIVSALLFGLMHQNFNQFFMAFILGIFLAHIDIKHNSLLPSIIIHALVNTTSLVTVFSGVLNNAVTAFFTGLGVISLTIAGFIMLMAFYKKNRLPYTMPHQKLRNGTVISSIMLMASISLLLVFTILNSFPSLLG